MTQERHQQIQIDLSDPSTHDRCRSGSYFQVYANRAEVTITNWDVQIGFGQFEIVLGEKPKLHDHGKVFMSFEQAATFGRVLSELVENAGKSMPLGREPLPGGGADSPESNSD